jgi:hypothetical protein
MVAGFQDDLDSDDEVTASNHQVTMAHVSSDDEDVSPVVASIAKVATAQQPRHSFSGKSSSSEERIKVTATHMHKSEDSDEDEAHVTVMQDEDISDEGERDPKANGDLVVSLLLSVP